LSLKSRKRGNFVSIIVTPPPVITDLKRRVPFTIKLLLNWDPAYGVTTSDPFDALAADMIEFVSTCI
jgi:hypothetical protein